MIAPRICWSPPGRAAPDLPSGRAAIAAALFFLGVTVTASVACDANFRFDDHDAAVSDALTAIGWSGGDACTAGCNLSCPGPRPCVGSCANACTAVCPPGGDCTLSAERDSTVTCESARCSVTVLDQSLVRCQGTASCDLICPRDCMLECGASARCTIQCGNDAAPRIVTGLATCSDS